MSSTGLPSLLMLLFLPKVAAEAWCQSQGSCVGQLRRFEHQPLPWWECPSDYPGPSSSGVASKAFKGLQFADWDADGDADLLLAQAGPELVVTLYEHLANGSFQAEDLFRAPWPASNSTLDIFEGPALHIDIDVVDWDGDGGLDILLCTEFQGSANISILERAGAPIQQGSIMHLQTNILHVDGSECLMHSLQALDFDEDGDVDLFVGQRYFERTSTGLVERLHNENPIHSFGGKVELIDDLDGDGRVELLVTDWSKHNEGPSLTRKLRYFHRTADGSFVEQKENPLAHVGLITAEGGIEKPCVIDWNSDGWQDLMVVTYSYLGDRFSACSFGYGHYRHVMVPDLMHNTHMGSYAHLNLGSWLKEQRLSVIDWNGDSLLDLVVSPGLQTSLASSWPKLYENHPFSGATEVELVFENVTATFMNHQSFGVDYRFAVEDFDGNGEPDLLIVSQTDGKVHYHRKVLGSLLGEEKSHPFSGITVKRHKDPWNHFSYYAVQPFMVDFDQDGDMDLILGPPDGRFFEQKNGTLHEWPLEQSPVRNLLAELDHYQANGEFQHDEYVNGGYVRREEAYKKVEWRFLDCDLDGDLDLIRLGYVKEGHWQQKLQACERLGASKLRCDDDFWCLGTNLSTFDPLGFGPVTSFDLGDLSDGLQLIARHESTKGAVLWTSGFCTPEDACYQMGLCLPKHVNCSCIAGHELVDCSGCEPNFYSVQRNVGQMHACAACPGAEGKVCHGRGSCFDDTAARHAPRQESSTAALTASGNGSCGCYEIYFLGKDDEGRGTCMDGHCPAGSEEKDGTCESCEAGSASLEGGTCKKCQAGSFSLAGSGNCTRCSPGRVAGTLGASACEDCPVGRYEFQQQFCNECPAGFFSSIGNYGSCTKCPAGFIAPNPGSSTCIPCPGGSFSEEASAKCIPCAAGSVSGATSEVCKECDAGFFAKDSITCEPCPGGTYSGNASNTCLSCAEGHVSNPKSAACRRCNGLMLRASPDATKQFCHVAGMDVVLAFISWSTSACFCFLFLMGCYSSIPISDVSAQGPKLVLTTAVAHWVLERSCPEVTFGGTGVPDLERSCFRVKALNSLQLTLDGQETTMSLDTSMGFMQLKPLQGFFVTGVVLAGLVRCPLICWCMLQLAAACAAAIQLKWLLTLLVCSLGLCTGAVAFALRRRSRTALAQRRRQFLKEWPLALQRCGRGPERSMSAGQLQDFLQFFETFIKERSMYYVCSNIVKPLTELHKMSLVELVGPRQMEWFVSHYWGMSVRHFGEAIRKHAISSSSDFDWREVGYWICTFSNNQWHVEEELGDGHWQSSSFYLALRSPECKGTAMIIDELVLPLQRIWCLFEVYHTIRLSGSGSFQGLLLCTSTGVLQEGKAGTDVAVAVAQRAAELDTRSASATAEEDRQMIHRLIEQMPGGFETMNTFVRETICRALEASHQHYEQTFLGLVNELSSASSAASLPTLLVSQRKTREELSKGSDSQTVS